jgi:hypothetical protein
LCEIHLLVPEGKEVETILEVQAKVWLQSPPKASKNAILQGTWAAWYDQGCDLLIWQLTAPMTWMN